MKKMVRSMVAASLAGVMAVSLAGCGGNKQTPAETTAAVTDASKPAETTAKETEAATAGEKVTLRFMHDWPEYETQFNQIVEDFEKSNPDIEIETTVITWDVLTKTLQTAFASGDAPDVTCCWLDRLGGFNALGAAYDLTEVMEADGAAWKNEFIPASLDLGTVGGKILGVPFRSTCTILVYNKTMLEENGWQEPKNQTELIELMDQVAAKGIIPLIAPGNGSSAIIRIIHPSHTLVLLLKVLCCISHT